MILAAVNVAMADAAIACWEAKYHYVAWRPVTAIRLADTDGNPATSVDPSWVPLLITPAHPEYPSGHSTVSGAAATVLAHYFGGDSSFNVDSDVMTGVVRSFPNFAAALAEIVNARVYGGIHSALRVMMDRQRVLLLENMSCSMRSGERMGTREKMKIGAGRDQNSVG